MRLNEYINSRLDGGESNVTVLGLQNGMSCNLDDALTVVPQNDLNSEISNQQNVTDGQTLIWLNNNSEPAYSVQK